MLVHDLAEHHGVSMAEMVRAIVFDREPATPVVPCSPFHENCTAAHRDVVDGYREQRTREELALEAETGNYRGDLALWRENGNRLTNFNDWLKGRTA